MRPDHAVPDTRHYRTEPDPTPRYGTKQPIIGQHSYCTHSDLTRLHITPRDVTWRDIIQHYDSERVSALAGRGLTLTYLPFYCQTLLHETDCDHTRRVYTMPDLTPRDDTTRCLTSPHVIALHLTRRDSTLHHNTRLDAKKVWRHMCGRSIRQYFTLPNLTRLC